MKISLLMFLAIQKVHVFPVKMRYFKRDNFAGKLFKTGFKESHYSRNYANFHRKVNEMRDVISMTRLISSFIDCHGVFEFIKRSN